MADGIRIEPSARRKKRQRLSRGRGKTGAKFAQVKGKSREKSAKPTGASHVPQTLRNKHSRDFPFTPANFAEVFFFVLGAALPFLRRRLPRMAQGQKSGGRGKKQPSANFADGAGESNYGYAATSASCAAVR